MRLKFRELPGDNVCQQQSFGQELTRIGDAWNVETGQSVLSFFLTEDGSDDLWPHREKKTWECSVKLNLNSSSFIS